MAGHDDMKVVDILDMSMDEASQVVAALLRDMDPKDRLAVLAGAIVYDTAGQLVDVDEANARKIAAVVFEKMCITNKTIFNKLFKSLRFAHVKQAAADEAAQLKDAGGLH